MTDIKIGTQVYQNVATEGKILDEVYENLAEAHGLIKHESYKGFAIPVEGAPSPRDELSPDTELDGVWSVIEIRALPVKKGC